MKEAIASRLIPFTQGFLMGKSGEWYKTNKYFRYKKGDHIKLRSKSSFGFGIDPRGEIVDCISDKNILGEVEDFYVIEMDCYDYDYHCSQGNHIEWEEWFMGKKLPNDHKRVLRRERYFKWNIEYHFKLKR